MWYNVFGLFQKKTEAPLNPVEAPAVSSGAEFVDPEERNLSADQLSSLYLSNSWVRKYIDILANGCAKYKLQAVPAPGVNAGAAKAHCEEVNTLLSYANDVETFSDVRVKYLKDLLLFGNGALEVQPKNGTTIKFLYAAPGYLLRAKFDLNGNLTKSNCYAFVDPSTGEEGKVTYGKEDIVHFKLDQLSDRFYGSSPIASAYKEFNADSKAIKEMERGDFGISAQIIAFPKQTKSFISTVMSSIQAVITGKGGNKVVSVNTEDIKRIALSDKTYKDEFEFQKWLVQRHNVFGIPPFKLGFVESTGSMSAREQREEFQSLISTLVTYECEKLTLILCRTRLQYEDVIITAPELVTRLDYDKARVLDRLVMAGIITPNEAREKYLGLDRANDKYADQLYVKSMMEANEVDPETLELNKKKTQLLEKFLGDAKKEEEQSEGA
jgi:phage portal protein BeeE